MPLHEHQRVAKFPNFHLEMVKTHTVGIAELNDDIRLRVDDVHRGAGVSRAPGDDLFHLGNDCRRETGSLLPGPAGPRLATAHIIHQFYQFLNLGDYQMDYGTHIITDVSNDPGPTFRGQEMDNVAEELYQLGQVASLHRAVDIVGQASEELKKNKIFEKIDKKFQKVYKDF